MCEGLDAWRSGFFRTLLSTNQMLADLRLCDVPQSKLEVGKITFQVADHTLITWHQRSIGSTHCAQRCLEIGDSAAHVALAEHESQMLKASQPYIITTQADEM